MFLEVKNVSKKFGQNVVISNASFGIDKGEVVALLGESGAGKTTLLRCLNFLETPDKGTIEIDGKQVFDAETDIKLSDDQIREKRKHFGLVFQAFNLFPQYTVKDNITLAPLLHGVNKDELNAKVDTILEDLGLESKKDFYPYQLSGGQQQRVAIARALALEPDVLCFDEPTSALDPMLVGEVVNVIKKLKDEGSCIMVVTHDMSFASKVADRIVFIADGLIEEIADSEKFFSNPTSEKSKEFISHLGYTN